jgi:hypothetical protein
MYGCQLIWRLQPKWTIFLNPLLHGSGPCEQFLARSCGVHDATVKVAEPKNAYELPIGRFPKSKSLGGNRVISTVIPLNQMKV